jgi:hypothetical protein
MAKGSIPPVGFFQLQGREVERGRSAKSALGSTVLATRMQQGGGQHEENGQDEDDDPPEDPGGSGRNPVRHHSLPARHRSRAHAKVFTG